MKRPFVATLLAVGTVGALASPAVAGRPAAPGPATSTPAIEERPEPVSRAASTVAKAPTIAEAEARRQACLKTAEENLNSAGQLEAAARKATDVSPEDRAKALADVRRSLEANRAARQILRTSEDLRAVEVACQLTARPVGGRLRAGAGGAHAAAAALERAAARLEALADGLERAAGRLAGTGGNLTKAAPLLGAVRSGVEEARTLLAGAEGDATKLQAARAALVTARDRAREAVAALKAVKPGAARPATTKGATTSTTKAATTTTTAAVHGGGHG